MLPVECVETVNGCNENDNLISRHGLQREISESFWQIWLEKYIRYLPPLMIKKQNADIKVGTVALLREEGKPRLRWPFGVVTRVFEGKDGLVRAVELKTSKGLITRAVQKLHRLEMLDDTETQAIDPQGGSAEEKKEIRAREVSGRDRFIPQSANICPKRVKPTFTRKGRLSKPTKIFDL